VVKILSTNGEIMNLSSEMQALCNNIISTSANRGEKLGSLRHETDVRKKTVAGLRSGFRKDSRAVRDDLAAAKGIWAAIAKG